MLRYRLLLAVAATLLTANFSLSLMPPNGYFSRANSSPAFAARSIARRVAGTRLASSAAAGAKAKNPKVFFDVAVDAKPAGRIVFELAADVAPKTAEVRSGFDVR